MIDGTFYCPAISEDLRTVVEDYRTKKIDHATFVARVKARKKFELVTKQNADLNGVGERVGCRAANHSLTVKCAEKEDSLTPRMTLDREGNLGDHRKPVFLPIEAKTNGLAPTICQVQTITLKPTDGAKFRQALPYGSPEHTDIYNRLRQSQEGMHGFAKDEAKEALGTPGRRRVRTKVAQQLFSAFLIAAANIRKIRNFLADADIDANGIPFVKRKTRKDDHARTGNPPGAAPPEEPKRPDEPDAA